MWPWKSSRKPLVGPVLSVDEVERLFAAAEFGQVWAAVTSLPPTRAVSVLRRLGDLTWRPRSKKDAPHFDELVGLARACPDEVPVGTWFTTAAVIACGKSYASISSVALSPDGKLLATGSTTAEPSLWQVPSGRKVAELHEMSAHDLVFTPDGRFLVGIGKPEVGPRSGVMVWAVPSGEQVLYLDFPDVRCLAVSPDSSLVAAGSRDGTVRLWELPSGTPAATMAGSRLGAGRLAISPDGRLLAAAAGNGQLFDGPGGVHLWHLPSGSPAGTVDTCRVDALTFAGSLVAGACGDGYVRLWRASGEEVATLAGSMGLAWELVSARSGQFLVAGCLDQTLRIWDASANRAVATHRQDERVVHVAATDTMIATGNLAGVVTWYNLPSGTHASSQFRSAARVESIALSDTTTVTGHDNGQAVIWYSTLRRAASTPKAEQSHRDLYKLNNDTAKAAGDERAWIDMITALTR